MEYIYIIVQLMIMMMMMYMSIRLIKRSSILSDILNRPISELPHKLEMILFCFFFFPECSHLNLPGNCLLVIGPLQLTDTAPRLVTTPPRYWPRPLTSLSNTWKLQRSISFSPKLKSWCYSRMLNVLFLFWFWNSLFLIL